MQRSNAAEKRGSVAKARGSVAATSPREGANRNTSPPRRSSTTVDKDQPSHPPPRRSSTAAVPEHSEGAPHGASSSPRHLTRRSTVDTGELSRETTGASLTSGHPTLRRGSSISGRSRTMSAASSEGTRGVTLASVSETAMAATREISVLKEAHAEEVGNMRSEIARLEERIGSAELEINHLHGQFDRGQQRTVEQIAEVTNSMSLFHNAVGTCREELAAARRALERERDLAIEKTNELTQEYEDFRHHSTTMLNKFQTDSHLFEEQVKGHKAKLEHLSTQLTGLQKELYHTKNEVTLLKSVDELEQDVDQNGDAELNKVVPVEPVPTPQTQARTTISPALTWSQVQTKGVGRMAPGMSVSFSEVGAMASSAPQLYTTNDHGIVIPPTPQPVAGRTTRSPGSPLQTVRDGYTYTYTLQTPPATPGQPNSPRLQKAPSISMQQAPQERALPQQPQQQGSPSFSPSTPHSPRNGYTPVLTSRAGAGLIGQYAQGLGLT